MSTNDFLPFGIAVGANVIDQSTYDDLVARLTGFQSGTALSAQLNKVWRQSSIIGAMIGQFIADQSGEDAVDDGTTADLLANFEAGVRKSSAINVLTDTGTANTYAAANTVPTTALPTVSGVVQRFQVAHSNTGASTYNPDAKGTAPIVGLAGSALQGNEMIAGGDATLMSYVGPLLNGGSLCWVLLDCSGGSQQVADATASHHAITKGQADAAYASIGASSSKIQSITATVASNAMTVGLNPTILDFRSPTLTTGVPNTRTIASALSLVIPAGATLGSVSTVQEELVLIAIDNAGTVELAVINIAGGVNLDETTLINTTAISSGASSASVFYSNTARTGVPFRVVGAVFDTQTTAGTRAAAPTLVQGMGGQALATMQSLGFGQSLQDMTASRAFATTYYNLTGKPIFVSIYAGSSNPGTSLSLSINGGAAFIFAISQLPSGSAACAGSFVVPVRASYAVTSIGPGLLTNWSETR